MNGINEIYDVLMILLKKIILASAPVVFFFLRDNLPCYIIFPMTAVILHNGTIAISQMLF